MNDGNDVVAAHFLRSCDTLDRAANDPCVRAAIHAIADVVIRAFRHGAKLLIAGNGGSAADAQHIAGELLSRFNFDRDPLPAIALTTDTSVLTAIGNDYGFDRAFERQVRGLGRPGDARPQTGEAETRQGGPAVRRANAVDCSKTTPIN